MHISDQFSKYLSIHGLTQASTPRWFWDEIHDSDGNVNAGQMAKAKAMSAYIEDAISMLQALYVGDVLKPLRVEATYAAHGL